MVMLISYHIKAELCTLFDKVHKAFINSANAPSLCTFYRLPTVCLSADTAAQPVEARLALPGRGMFAMTWRGIAAVWRRGDCRGLPAETKGAGTPRFPCPFCLRRQTAALPAVEGGHSAAPSEGVKSPPAAHRCIGGRFTVSRRYKRKGRCPVGDNLQNVHI